MTKFITLDMFLEQNKRKSTATHRMEEVPFLEWKVGYTIAAKGSGSQWKITNMSTPKMTYQSSATLTGMDEEQRILKGSTLQSGYTFVSKGDAVEEEDNVPPANTKKLTMNVDHIRNFYDRKHGEPGGRIVISDRVSYIVVQNHAAISSLIKGAEEV